MATVTINSYADVQKQLGLLISANSLTPGLAPHGAFWSSLSYADFTSGTVPNLGVPILTIGDSKSSTIIQVLKGGAANQTGFPDMPRPSPQYNAKTPTQDDIITAFAAWIDAGCPENAASLK